MITPADIENKEFTKVKKGYSEDEVDEFLDLIIVDMEKLIRENKQLKAELGKAHSQVDKHMSTEASVYETLESARTLMNDIAASAERRAEILVKNAELEANLITREAKESISKYTDEGNKILRRVEALREGYRQMLESELTRLDFAGNELLQEFSGDFREAAPAEGEKVEIPESFAKPEIKTPEAGEFDLTRTMVNVR